MFHEPGQYEYELESANEQYPAGLSGIQPLHSLNVRQLHSAGLSFLDYNTHGLT